MFEPSIKEAVKAVGYAVFVFGVIVVGTVAYIVIRSALGMKSFD
jgi:hypothetical protein